ncbi:hypothetical protein LINPERPRIM_LOCUS29209 [Linum perenne]
MDNGLSWADQWDYNNDPPTQSSNDKKKMKDGGGNKSSGIGKKFLSLKWMKDLRKKPSSKDGE